MWAAIMVSLLFAQSPHDLYPIVVGADARPGLGKTGLIGFIDSSGRVAIPPQFPAMCGEPERLPEFHEGLARARGDNGLLGYIDQMGRFAIAPQFQEIGDFHDGIASVAATPVNPAANAAAAWIDHTGKALFKREYHLEAGNPLQGMPSARTDFSEGMLRLREGDLWGFVDTTFKWVIPPKYLMVDDFHEGLADVWLAGPKEALIDKTGQEGVSLTDMQAGSSFSGGLVSVTSTLDHHWGIINRSGREVIPLKFLSAGPLGDGYSSATKAEGSALFDSHGRQLTPFKFGFKPAFSGGLVPATLTGPSMTFGYMNASGVWIIPPRFADASGFSGKLARITLKTGDFGYVNRRGKVVWSGGRMTPCMAM
jgi:hypothetical protein